MANLFGAAFNCYTTTGSFSRSAVMDSSGAKSQLAGIVSAIVVMFVLLFLTPVFKNMPQNVLGAIVISAIVSLFNYSEWFFLWKVRFMLCAPQVPPVCSTVVRLNTEVLCYAVHVRLPPCAVLGIALSCYVKLWPDSMCAAHVKRLAAAHMSTKLHLCMIVMLLQHVCAC